MLKVQSDLYFFFYRILESHNLDNSFGTVYLVGAGPGDPDLLTVKAHRLITTCDAIVYDSLVPQEVLQLSKKECKLIFVGKKRGNHSFSQEKIHSLLLDLSKKHKCIVRLKGGDPFLFGRGGEEAAFLQNNKVSVSVIPGVSSGMAAPAYFGLPLTHRLAGSSVIFLTGHEGSNNKSSSLDWKKIAELNSNIVIFMGVNNLNYIVNQLLIGGLSRSTPCAVIQQGTIVRQRFLKTTLESLIYQVKDNKFIPPSIIIIGRIINYQVDQCRPKPADVTMPIVF